MRRTLYYRVSSDTNVDCWLQLALPAKKRMQSWMWYKIVARHSSVEVRTTNSTAGIEFQPLRKVLKIP